MFGLHVILEGQLGSVLHVLLVGFEVVFGVLPPWRETNEERMRRMRRRRKSNKVKKVGLSAPLPFHLIFATDWLKSTWMRRSSMSTLSILK